MDSTEREKTAKAKKKFIEKLDEKDFPDRKELLSAILEGTKELIADFGADLILKE